MRGLFTGVLFALCALAYCKKNNDEVKLIDHLATHIVTYARPVSKSSDVTLVYFGFALYEADIEKEFKRSAVVNLRGVARYQWKDVNLKWDPKEYGGVSAVRLPNYSVWKPDTNGDIKLFNSHTEPAIESSNVVVYSSGQVLWIPKTNLQVVCDKLTDTYECLLKFGSWTYDGNQIDLDFYEGSAKIDLNDFKSRELKIVKNVGRKQTRYYSCCSEPYPDIRFNITLAAF